ncbi:PucR family transcriptional regulator [Saccharomonospora xinjiangensis]|uniref:PucR C-terminal helix-turn-helix domain-containing protein n=1 Tax=Saccharomonospora xinjiangensis XJ-54 TaxID=882086 RepID=I0V811_9PSEU|nr:helix-turn-helix domain-containing protein [Saccharomonospora xinjiangensis]EID56264.1 hypothetical protein SacxiDRAFT_4074 [Saccharomonospora xinjiangensis XJ-54]
MRAQGPRYNTSPVTRALAGALLREVEPLIGRLLAAIFTDNPAWTDYSPVPHDDLREGCRDYLTRVLEVLGGHVGPSSDDDVAATIARHRLAQGVPLEVMLRTFRLGGRIVWEAMLEQADRTEVPPDAVLEAGTATWTVIDHLSSALSTAYRDSELDRVRRDEQRRTALLEDLLGARAHDIAFATRAARELELPAASPYLAVVADINSDGIAALAGARTALAAVGIRSVWLSRVDTLVGLVALEHRSEAEVLARLRPLARGRAAVSPTVAEIAEVSTAHTLALLALGTAAPGRPGLVSLEDRLPESLLTRSPDLADLLVARSLGGVLRRPARERDVLLRTLAVWLEEDRSAAHAAARLHCHRNTVLNRLQRVSSLVGRPLHGRRAYVELSLALTALELPDEPL